MPAPVGNKYAEANSKFKDEFCEAVIELGREGKSPAQMASHFDVSRQTIDNWAAEHPKFLEALTRARAHSQAWWEDQGMLGMVGDKFNAAVWKKSMEARFREDYTERKEVSGPDGGAIELETKPSEALKDFLNAKSG